MESLIVSLAVVFVVVVILLKTAVVVPQQNAYVIERHVRCWPRVDLLKDCSSAPDRDAVGLHNHVAYLAVAIPEGDCVFGKHRNCYL